MIGEKFDNGEERPKEVVIEDRRFSRDDTSVEEPAKETPRPDSRAAAKAGPEETAGEPIGPEGPTDILDLGIDNFLKYVMSLAMALAWIYLGLQADPKTGVVAKDVAKASTCIDTIEWVYGRYKNDYSPEERAEIERVIRDLKLNYISAGAPN